MGLVLQILLFLVALFIILLVLVQRGRGGGLVGALGGMGGQSAFGAKAGDTFTWITFGAVGVWVLLCILTVVYYGRSAGGWEAEGFGQNTPITDPAGELESRPGAAGGTGSDAAGSASGSAAGSTDSATTGAATSGSATSGSGDDGGSQP